MCTGKNSADGNDKEMWLGSFFISCGNVIDSIILLLCCSSGKAPTIENADRAVATTSKLSVGSYHFKLVVKDSEGLTSEDMVTINVKEGNSPYFVPVVSRSRWLAEHYCLMLLLDSWLLGRLDCFSSVAVCSRQCIYCYLLNQLFITH